jgi:hypothetical protein
MENDKWKIKWTLKRRPDDPKIDGALPSNHVAACGTAAAADDFSRFYESLKLSNPELFQISHRSSLKNPRILL